MKRDVLNGSKMNISIKWKIQINKRYVVNWCIKVTTGNLCATFNYHINRNCIKKKRNSQSIDSIAPLQYK